MAIAFIQHVTEASNVTPSTLTYPAASTGNLLAAIIGTKPNSRTPTPPAGLFDGSNNHGTASGGVPPNGGDTGTVRVDFWSRTVDGGEPATSSIAWAGGTPGPTIQSMLEFSKTKTGAWSVASAFGVDSTQSTGAAAIDATAATDPGYQPGDLVVVAYTTPTDAGIYTNPVITVPSCTLGVANELVDYGTTVGNDGRLHVWSATVTTGSSTAAPQFQCDVDAINASAGVTLFARLREPVGGSESLSDKLVFDGTDWKNINVMHHNGTDWV